MIKSKYDIVGVMSGTSLDGIDLAHVTLEFNDTWSFKIHQAETIPYPPSWKNELSNLVGLNLEGLQEMDRRYTSYLAEVIAVFLRKHELQHIDAVCSHGHTALHQPEQNLTYQIGNLKSIAELTKQRVVCDFRTQDVQFGGQGAPLVPIGDRLLFSEYDYCINLGGFANLSSEVNHERIAFDICPVNIVMNRYAELLGLDFDRDGKIAQSGEIDQGMLDALNNLEYYQAIPPKSLGLEWVEDHVFKVLKSSNISKADVLRTFVEHIAFQIAQQIHVDSKVLFTGGGAYNTFLMKRIAAQKRIHSVLPSNILIEYKEALIFGLLGVLKLRNEVNCLSSVTGAKMDHSSGAIYNP
ncbi:anhydro-N-acetylmuramic acid kinase [Psychroserpens sp.]|uniref:anhydro-N-acetylmuramic acid kinase n=1 Tax=Psychroserpens sp. TaxID=2020870 RepID=UPI003C71F845